MQEPIRLGPFGRQRRVERLPPVDALGPPPARLRGPEIRVANGDEDPRQGGERGLGLGIGPVEKDMHFRRADAAVPGGEGEGERGGLADRGDHGPAGRGDGGGRSLHRGRA